MLTPITQLPRDREALAHQTMQSAACRLRSSCGFPCVFFHRSDLGLGFQLMQTSSSRPLFGQAATLPSPPFFKAILQAT